MIDFRGVLSVLTNPPLPNNISYTYKFGMHILYDIEMVPTTPQQPITWLIQ